MTMKMKIIDEQNISHLENNALENGILKVMPSLFYQSFTKDQILQFCVKHGFYLLPTVELIDMLHFIIKNYGFNESDVIEIGSGSGVLCQALGIQGTDSKVQDMPEVKARYKALKQATINYPDHVLKMDGVQAVKEFKPKMVIASWITQIWKDRDCIPGKSKASIYGIDENFIIDNVPVYVHVGAESVHNEKRIMPKIKTKVKNWDYIFSRSFTDDDIIYIWENEKLL